MDEKPIKAYLITVTKSTHQVLDLLTRKREFALLATNQRLSPAQEEVLQLANCLWIEIRDAAGTAAANQVKYYYLVVSLESHVSSRDALPTAGLLPSSGFGACLRELECDGCIKVTLLPIGALYELCEKATLVVDIEAEDLTEDEANGFWLHDVLRLGADPGKWYASDDFSSIKVNLKRAGAQPEVEAAEESESCDESVPVDISEFEIYDRLRGKLEHMAKDGGYGYPNDVFVEYSVGLDGVAAHYCATEFYSNHNWDQDPANLLVVRFSSEIAAGACSLEDVRFAHPTKATEHKATHERYLVDRIAGHG